MPKQKATHCGECQICGRVQKLPNGQLSNHGYTVEWSMFQGTCPGSKELPYELSCDLIKARLPWVTEQVAEMKKYREFLLQPANEPKAWAHVYMRSIHAYSWMKEKLSEEYHKNEQSGHEWRDIVVRYKDDGEEKVLEVGQYSNRNETLLECATRLNADYVRRHYNKAIEENERYLRWCEDRIAKWEEKQLQSI